METLAITAHNKFPYPLDNNPPIKAYSFGLTGSSLIHEPHLLCAFLSGPNPSTGRHDTIKAIVTAMNIAKINLVFP
jgi:hypothetical protein